MPLRVVLDTNLFIAAYWKRSSASARILDACIEGKLRACITPDVEQELWRVVRTIRAAESYAARISNLIGRAERIDPWASVAEQSEDPDDQKFLVCAASAGADYLITSDAHLLRFGSVGQARIVTPGEFWRIEMQDGPPAC